jgi:hypothetical protein
MGRFSEKIQLLTSDLANLVLEELFPPLLGAFMRGHPAEVYDGWILFQRDWERAHTVAELIGTYLGTNYPSGDPAFWQLRRKSRDGTESFGSGTIAIFRDSSGDFCVEFKNELHVELDEDPMLKELFGGGSYSFGDCFLVRVDPHGLNLSYKEIRDGELVSKLESVISPEKVMQRVMAILLAASWKDADSLMSPGIDLVPLRSEKVGEEDSRIEEKISRNSLRGSIEHV